MFSAATVARDRFPGDISPDNWNRKARMGIPSEKTFPGRHRGPTYFSQTINARDGFPSATCRPGYEN
ncbi:hypothetical protein Tco_1245543 [Tanacetum coccineum]